ncbi:hypothetical protein [Lysinibacillus fusiformis]|uniref:hypothetical protein n=1 Tax=Lysinibacillus fusiformis TaxID=28031 RepID=UPI003019E1AF
MSKIGGYIIYHPTRKKTRVKGTNIYFDDNNHNQDPYIWNSQFLHSTCHMTELKEIQKSQNFSNRFFVIFWVSGDENEKFKDFSSLYCDLIFVVKEKIIWNEETLNDISPLNPVVDSNLAYTDHYFWVPIDHPYKSTRYGRFTLKANLKKSFQPQNSDGNLIDILHLITKVANCTSSELRERIRKGKSDKSFRSYPVPLTEDEVQELYNSINNIAQIKLRGPFLEKIRKSNSDLASPPFGFKSKKGILKIKKNEAEVVKKIFEYFISTKSLNLTLECLMKRGCEFIPGLTNKSIIAILSNDIYVNELITIDVFNKANDILRIKNII